MVFSFPCCRHYPLRKPREIGLPSCFDNSSWFKIYDNNTSSVFHVTKEFSFVEELEMQLFGGGLSLCSLPLAPSVPCPAPTPDPWWKGPLVFSKVGGLSFGLSLWDVCVCVFACAMCGVCECVCEQLWVPLVLLWAAVFCGSVVSDTVD